MNRLQELRQQKGWTQTQLGKRINAAKTTVSGYEQGDHQMTAALVCTLCDIFGCTSDYLLGRSENPWPEISDQEAAFLAAYRAAPDNVKNGIDVLLLPFMQEKRSAS